MFDSYHHVMALFKYFKRERGLPDPQGPLSETVHSTSTEEANKVVKAELTEKCGKAHAPYMVAIPTRTKAHQLQESIFLDKRSNLKHSSQLQPLFLCLQQ